MLRYTIDGWPTEVDADLQPYQQRRHEISMEAGCLLWGMKVIIPSNLQTWVLSELHTGHPGIVRMKSLARTLVWWPGIDKQIEHVVSKCMSCQQLRNKPPPVSLHPWNWPTRPWQRIHADFAGPIFGTMFLVVVDAHSKWLEVVPMSTTTSEKTITELRKLFSSHGLPEQLVTDNGTQFTSREFEVFLKENGIKHIRSAPYHPATNGEAERFVQTFKHAMKAAQGDAGTLPTKLARFLLTYRSTPNTTTGISPAELFLHRRLRTRLEMLRPDMASKVLEKQADQKSQHDRRSKERSFECGDSVMVENHRGGPKWVRGSITERLGPISYRVQVGEQFWKRHVDQLLRAAEPHNMEGVAEEDTSTQGLPQPADVGDTGDRSDRDEVTEPVGTTSGLTILPPRYPTRRHEPPERLDPSFH